MELNIIYGCRKCHEETEAGNGMLYRGPGKCEKHNLDLEKYIHNGSMLPYGFWSDFIAENPEEIMGAVRRIKDAAVKGYSDYVAFFEALVELNLKILFNKQ